MTRVVYSIRFLPILVFYHDQSTTVCVYQPWSPRTHKLRQTVQTSGSRQSKHLPRCLILTLYRTKCRGLMLAPYIYDTDSVQEHLLCRAEANNTASESNNRTSETAEVSNHSDLEVHDLDALMQEPPSPKGRL